MISPDEARARFGTLSVPVGSAYVHQYFSDPETGGEWRQVFDADGFP